MRPWLIMQKQKISEKLYQQNDDLPKTEEEKKLLDEIIYKVVEKAKFMVMLETPSSLFKADN